MKSTTSKRIRIVKRDERAQREQPREQEAKKTPQVAARDMVATVSGWVNELQQRHRTETARAIKTLFPEITPQAN